MCSNLSRNQSINMLQISKQLISSLAILFIRIYKLQVDCTWNYIMLCWPTPNIRLLKGEVAARDCMSGMSVLGTVKSVEVVVRAGSTFSGFRHHNLEDKKYKKLNWQYPIPVANNNC